MCIAALLIASAVSAQTVESALGRSGYSEAHKDSITSFFARLEVTGIPIELLLSKLEEGIAKRIPASTVLEALEREMENLRKARALVLRIEGGQRLLSDPASWARSANLLAAGIPAQEVGQLIALCISKVEGYRPATYLYVALRDWGLARESAFELIGSLLNSSIVPEQYAGVMDLLATGRRRRIPPEQLVKRIQQHLEQTDTIEELEKWIY
jgi:hypothetical protein